VHRYMMKLADRFPLTDLPRANSLRGTLVLSEELPARPPRLDNLASSSLPDVLGRQGYAPGGEIVKSQTTGALFVVAPLKLTSGTCSPVRALALVPLS
jgi:hypothetical protein